MVIGKDKFGIHNKKVGIHYVKGKITSVRQKERNIGITNQLGNGVLGLVLYGPSLGNLILGQRILVTERSL